MSLTNGGKPFNALNKASNGYETNCIDCWRLIKTYITKHGSVTKRGIKATIKATTTRCCGTIYKHSTKPIQGTNNKNICHNSTLWHSLGTSIHWLNHRRFFGRHHTSDRLRTSSCSIFKYRDEVVGSSGPVHLTEDFCFISPRDGNFAPPRLTWPSPASPCTGFPRPVKVMGQGWGKILVLHHGAGRGWI